MQIWPVFQCDFFHLFHILTFWHPLTILEYCINIQFSLSSSLSYWWSMDHSENHRTYECIFFFKPYVTLTFFGFFTTPQIFKINLYSFSFSYCATMQWDRLAIFCWNTVLFSVLWILMSWYGKVPGLLFVKFLCEFNMYLQRMKSICNILFRIVGYTLTQTIITVEDIRRN